MQGPFLRKYGVETKINFVLYEVDGVDLRVDAADGGSDCTIMKDEGAEATCTNDFIDEGIGYSLTLDATEMEAARIVVYVVDSATKVWLDDAIVVETYGNASAMHAFDLDTATQDVNAIQISGDAIAANNLELQYDGTGLIGDNYPFTQSEGAAIGGGLAINTTMASVTVVLGSEQDLANASTSDDSRWTGDDDGSGAEFIFRCTPADTDNIPVEIMFEGYYDEPAGADNGATVQVYNFNTASWDTIISLTKNTKDEDHEVPLSHAHKAPGGDTLEGVAYTIGDVLIKFKQDTQETGDACLLLDHLVVGFVGSLVTATEIVDEWESQSQADPTGFHVNVKEVNGTAQTANDNGSDINDILTDTAAQDTATKLRTLMTGADTPVCKDSTPLTAAETESECNDALIVLNLDHLMKTAVSNRDTIPEVVDDTVLANLMTKTDGDTSDFDHATDSLEALRDRGDAAWSGAPTVLETTIDTVETADTVFDLIAGSAQNDAYNNMIVAITDAGDGSTETRRIIDYVAADKRITIDAEITFPVAAGDAVIIYQGAYAPVGAASITEGDKNDIVDKVWDEADADHMTQGTKGLKMHHSGKGRY